MAIRPEEVPGLKLSTHNFLNNADTGLKSVRKDFQGRQINPSHEINKVTDAGSYYNYSDQKIVYVSGIQGNRREAKEMPDFLPQKGVHQKLIKGLFNVTPFHYCRLQ